MKKRMLGAAFAAVLSSSGFVLTFATPADAACRQVLAPNRWQYITVCDGNRGGANYSGTIAAGVAAGAIAIELLPGVLGTVGEITSGVGDVTSGVVNNLGNAATNAQEDLLKQYLTGRNQNSGGLNDGTLTAPTAKKKNGKKEEETPSLFGFLTPAPQVNTPTVNATAPQVNAPEVNAPSPFNIFAPQVNTIFAPQVNTPTTRVKTPRANTPTAPQVNAPSPFNIFAPRVNTATPRVE